MKTTTFIVNPASANGKTGRIWHTIQRRLRNEFDFPLECKMTQAPGHATLIAAQAVEKGIERVVSVGGEGTLNEIINGLLDPSLHGPTKAAVGIIGVGTSNDFIKTLGWEPSLDAAILRLKRGAERCIDGGLARFVDMKGRPASRFFVNIADFGAGGAVVERVNRTTKRFGGALSFLWGIVTTLLTYRSPWITCRIDASENTSERFLNVIVANGRYYGGGILAAPGAHLEDGKLFVVLIGDMHPAKALLNLPRFRKGTHLSHPKIRHSKARLIEAWSERPVYINLDGEQVGTLPARFKSVPRTIRLLV